MIAYFNWKKNEIIRFHDFSVEKQIATNSIALKMQTVRDRTVARPKLY